MGTDITVYVEMKVGDKWENVGLSEVTRNYLLFAIISDIRGTSKELTGKPCIGQPVLDFNDCSEYLQKQFQHEWWHEACILDKSDWQRVSERFKKHVVEADEYKENRKYLKKDLQELQRLVRLLDQMEKELPVIARTICLFDS